MKKVKKKWWELKTVQKWGSRTFWLLARFSSNKTFRNLVKFPRKFCFPYFFCWNFYFSEFWASKNANFFPGAHWIKISAVCNFDVEKILFSRVDFSLKNSIKVFFKKRFRIMFFLNDPIECSLRIIDLRCSECHDALWIVKILHGIFFGFWKNWNFVNVKPNRLELVFQPVIAHFETFQYWFRLWYSPPPFFYMVHENEQATNFHQTVDKFQHVGKLFQRLR